MRMLLITLLLSTKVLAQYPFEKSKSPDRESFEFVTLVEDQNLVYVYKTVSLGENQHPVSVSLQNDPADAEKSIILISDEGHIQKFTDNVSVDGLGELYVADINGDGYKDIKITLSYLGTGLGSFYTRVIYFFQQPSQQFIKVAYDDMQEKKPSRKGY